MKRIVAIGLALGLLGTGMLVGAAAQVRQQTGPAASAKIKEENVDATRLLNLQVSSGSLKGNMAYTFLIGGQCVLVMATSSSAVALPREGCTAGAR